MAFTFLHAADIHLDSPLQGLSQFGDEEKAEAVRNDTRAALENLVGEAIDREVNFLVIAGDLFDGNWKDVSTGLFFSEQMQRLGDADIPAFVLHGNHDADSKITKALKWPENVQVFDHKKPTTFKVHELDVALHGQSFENAAVTDNLAITYPNPVPGHFNIGVLHTALDSNSRHAPYAPCSLQELRNKGYDYWALGHVHDYAKHGEHPPVVFPGNLQGRNIRETGPKGAVLVKVDDSGTVELERLIVDATRWHRIEADLSDVEDFDTALASVGARLREIHAENDDRLNAVRVIFSGKSDAFTELAKLGGRELRDHVANEVVKVAAQNFLLEKVQNRVEPRGSAETTISEGAIGELAKMFDQLTDEPDFLQALENDLKSLVHSHLPQEARDLSDEVELVHSQNLSRLAKQVTPDLLARLQGYTK